MTKIPYTNRAFPADDYYTFHRIGNPGKAQVHDSNTMRLHNLGSSNLGIYDILISNKKLFEFKVRSSAGNRLQLPLSVKVGDYVDVDINFTGSTEGFTNGLFKERIDIISNADDGIDGHAVLHAGYSPITEGGLELGAQSIFDVFGFKTNMLSIVNNNGSINPVNKNRYRPGSNYPLAANVDAGYEGDLVLSPAFVQADPDKPIYGVQIAAFHGKEGPSSTKFIKVNSSEMVAGGIYMAHSEYYHQTLLPRNKGNIDLINYGYSKSIKEPFRIAIGNYLSSGGNDLDGDSPNLLGVRVYKVRNAAGQIIPNEYLVIHDYVGGGCGTGGGYNCDWNDNVFYFINIRPEAMPQASAIKAYTAKTNAYFSFDVSGFFDIGYPGNKLNYSATAPEDLPDWLSINHISDIISGVPPQASKSIYKVGVKATDLNGIEVSSNFMLYIDMNKKDKSDSFTSKSKIVKEKDPFSITNNNLNVNDYSDAFKVSSTKSTLSTLKIIPNPATEKFEITLLDSHALLTEISIYDLKGVQVKSLKPEAFRTSRKYYIPLNDLSAGVYIINATDETGQMEKLKLIVKK